ncbi:MAG: N,N-dimethylformamidase beta subunit family domain-containing protein, partial [Nitrososphaerales archaeon]
ESAERGWSWSGKAAPDLLGRSAADLLVAASVGRDGAATSHFNGKIDGVRVFSAALTEGQLRRLESDAPPERVVPAKKGGGGLVASWDFARETHSTRVRDASGHGAHARTVNFPMRAVTGHNWSGHEYDFRRAPGEYNAIYFHDDDLGDAGWKVDFQYTVDPGARSGVYAAWVRAGDHEDYIPFFVRPKRGKKPTARIALLVPTLSYLAYAEEHALSDPNVRRALEIKDTDYPSQPQDVYAIENHLLGLYDRHSDGTGVCFTSRLRPVVNMRPKYVSQSLNAGKGSPHQLNADLHLVDWMESCGYQFDVITDEDLHAEGTPLLSPYRVIVTGSHPEYWTERMLDSMRSYLDEGGRMMYLGGNGFYWVTEVNPESPYIFEVRRWGGTGTWKAEPGEYHDSFTGELGGVWRNRGREPQKMVGVGFTAQGFDFNRPYVRDEGSRDPRMAFVFEGLGEDEPIGDHPSLVMNSGAAGYELDRSDHALGTPAHSLVLATASGFSDNYQHVIEENTLSDSKQGGTTHPLVRADMVYVPYPNNGAVFSVGSISWCGSLSYAGYKNSVSRVTGNVLARFSTADELPSFGGRGEALQKD